MKNLTCFLLLLLISSQGFAQDTQTGYAESIRQHREEYKLDFLKDESSPLREADLSARFFEPDERFRLRCRFEATPEEQPFELPTYSGITKPYRKYGVLSFEWEGAVYRLSVYQSLRTIRIPMYKDHLFLPFRDLTSGEETYGGGRYLDLKTADLEGEEIWVDLNKCYNPWCAYSDGYNCPIPPVENMLEIEVRAGEKLYAGEKKHR